MARGAGPFRGLIVSILIAAVFWLGLLGLLMGRGCSDTARAGVYSAGDGFAGLNWGR